MPQTTWQSLITPAKRYLPMGLMMLTLAGQAGCDVGQEKIAKDAELEQSVAYVKYLSSQRFLRQSTFPHTHPEQKPSQFIRYLFSEIGTAEWVITGDPFEEEQLKSILVPVPARNVLITNEYMPDVDKQLVLKSSDSEDQIIVEAYLGDHPFPSFTETIPFNPSQ